MNKETNELKDVDKLLYEEYEEIGEFESELFSLEYELDEEANLIAKLHNACRKTIINIKHLHALIRKIKKSADDRSIPILKKMLNREIKSIGPEIDELMGEVEVYNDDKSGEKTMQYCKRVGEIIKKKNDMIKEKYQEI